MTLVWIYLFEGTNACSHRCSPTRARIDTDRARSLQAKFRVIHISIYFPRMLILTWNRCCAVLFLVATLKTGTSQVPEARPKANSIKPVLLEETPTPATNRSTTVHSRITKKHNILSQVTLVMWFSGAHTSFYAQPELGCNEVLTHENHI